MKLGSVLPAGLTAKSLLARGYFPRDLPPPFTTTTLADAVAAAVTTGGSIDFGSVSVSRAVRYSLARPGGLRRSLSIPNPIHFTQLAQVVEGGWSSNELPLALARQKFASSTPRPSLVGRSLTDASGDPRAIREIAARASARVLVKTDVQNFYPSIYTHSIPWALHTKSKAKAQRHDMNLLGNLIDKCVRSAQDQQTAGIPIGPDTSWLIAEVILAVVDDKISARMPSLRGHRYNDDLAFAVSSIAQAQDLLALLQQELGEFELALNPRKTEILDLPQSLEPSGIAEIRQWPFRSTPRGLRADLLAFFDRVVALRGTGKTPQIVSYAVARLQALDLDGSVWPILEAMLLQLLVSEPSREMPP